MPPNRNRLGSGFEQLEGRDMMSTTLLGDQAIVDGLSNTAITREYTTAADVGQADSRIQLAAGNLSRAPTSTFGYDNLKGIRNDTAWIVANINDALKTLPCDDNKTVAFAVDKVTMLPKTGMPTSVSWTATQEAVVGVSAILSDASNADGGPMNVTLEILRAGEYVTLFQDQYDDPSSLSFADVKAAVRAGDQIRLTVTALTTSGDGDGPVKNAIDLQITFKEYAQDIDPPSAEEIEEPVSRILSYDGLSYSTVGDHLIQSTRMIDGGTILLEAEKGSTIGARFDTPSGSGGSMGMIGEWARIDLTQAGIDVRDIAFTPSLTYAGDTVRMAIFSGATLLESRDISSNDPVRFTSAQQITSLQFTLPATREVNNSYPATVRLSPITLSTAPDAGAGEEELALAPEILEEETIHLTSFTQDDVEAALFVAQAALEIATVEYMNTLTPRIEIVSMNGPDIVISVTLPPTQRAGLDLHYGVMDKSVSAPDGSTDIRVTMTLASNALNRSEAHDLVLQINGQNIDTIGLFWNAQTQSFSSVAQDRMYHEKVLPSSVVSAQAALALAEATMESFGGVPLQPDIAAEQEASPAAVSISNDSIDAMSETATRREIGVSILALNGLEYAVASLEAEIRDLSDNITHWQSQIAITGNDPAFSDTRQRITSYVNTLRNRQIAAPVELAAAQAELDAANARMDDLAEHLAIFVSSTEVTAFRQWVTDRASEARSALPQDTFNEWADRFAESNFASAPLVYTMYHLADPVVIKGFEEHALSISGLSRPIDQAVRECLQTMHGTIFGANAAEDRIKAEAWATANGTHLDFAIGAQQRISHEVTQSLLWMNEQIGPVVSFVFQEMLRKKLGLPLNTSVTDPMGQIFWGQPFAAVHMSGVNGSCIPTNAEIYAAVEANFDRMYEAYAHMNGEQEMIYAGSQFWGAVPYAEPTHTSAVERNMKAVEESSGGIGTVEERLLNMKRAFPAEFTELAARIRAGTLVMGPIAEAVLLGQTTVASANTGGGQGTGTVVVTEQEIVAGETVIVRSQSPWSGYLNSTVDPEQQRLAWNQMMDLDIGAASLDAPFFVRTDTGAGKLFSALIRGIRADASGAHVQELVEMTNYLTDIPMYRLREFIYALPKNDAAAQSGPLNLPIPGGLETRLKELFVTAQYGKIFESGVQNIHNLVTAAADKPTYQADEQIRVRFDMGLAGDASYHHANVYLIVDGQQVSTKLTADITNALYVDISARSLRAYLGDRLFADVQIGLQLMTEADGALTLENGKGIKTDVINVELYTSDASLVRNAAELSEADVRTLMNILKVEDFESLPEGNQEILRYFYKNILPTLSFKNGELIGDLHGTGDDQCKPWLQQIINAATGVNIPGNATTVACTEWVMELPDQAGVVRSEDGNTIRVAVGSGSDVNAILSSDLVKSGDIIQMAYGSMQHTMAVSKVETDGIWVLDTNWGPQYVSDTSGGFVKDGNGYRAFNESIDSAKERFRYDPDNTIRYHFFSFTQLEENVTGFSIYRVPNDSNGQ